MHIIAVGNSHLSDVEFPFKYSNVTTNIGMNNEIVIENGKNINTYFTILCDTLSACI